MTNGKKPAGTAHEAALSYAQSVTLDQLKAADHIMKTSSLFSRNEPGYGEARLAIAQIIAQNYNVAIVRAKE